MISQNAISIFVLHLTVSIKIQSSGMLQRVASLRGDKYIEEGATSIFKSVADGSPQTFYLGGPNLKIFVFYPNFCFLPKLTVTDPPLWRKLTGSWVILKPVSVGVNLNHKLPYTCFKQVSIMT
jgi:hypothetical protein